MFRYKNDPEDWSKFAKWDKFKYTRNLMHEGTRKYTKSPPLPIPVVFKVLGINYFSHGYEPFYSYSYMDLKIRPK